LELITGMYSHPAGIQYKVGRFHNRLESFSISDTQQVEEAENSIHLSMFSKDRRMWFLALPKRYFDQIRKLHICITFNSSLLVLHGEDVIEDYIYEYTDYLHAIVSRLQRTKLRNLTINVHFNRQKAPGAKYHAAAEIFLGPFRRLRNIRSFALRSVSGTGVRGSDLHKFTLL
jgi:hypothetical protein